MKAIIFDTYGGPEVLRLAQVPDPVPQAGELLIRVRAVGVNPADGKWRAGYLHQFVPLTFPHLGGYDVAGEVIGGEGLAAGTRVCAMIDQFRTGAYAELTIAVPEQLAILPDGMDFATGAALPTPGLTAVQAIDDVLGVSAGHRVLVTGATGAVGRYCVRAAKEAGATVVAGVRDSQRGEAQALGADEVIVLGGTYAGPPFDRIADTVGGEVVAPLCQAVKPDGRIVTLATTPIPADGVPVEIVFYGVHPDSAQLSRVIGWAASGAVPVPIAAKLPLAEAAEGQRRVDAGGAGGKIILEP
jgi:NADPH2:quinone reductase